MSPGPPVLRAAQQHLQAVRLTDGKGARLMGLPPACGAPEKIRHSETAFRWETMMELPSGAVGVIVKLACPSTPPASQKPF